MSKTLDFYFDFISPYAYLASRWIEDLAQRHRREVRWHPFRLGVAVVKVMGLKPLMETPLKGVYTLRDVKRLSIVLGEPLAETMLLSDPLPPARLFYASASPEQGARLAKRLLQARWAEGLDIGQKHVLKQVAGEVGWSPADVSAALDDPETRERLKLETQQALDKGVFGSPTVVVGEELFWGTDRLWLLDQYLAAGEMYRPASSSRLVALGIKEAPERRA